MVTATNKADYIPHHEPFQYYKSTANPTHARPTSVISVGKTDAANHQYDVHDFYDAIMAGNYPAVNFLKAPGYQDGHAGYSDPLDEQAFIVQVVNFLQQNSGDWQNTAVVIAYDDSDGWYDHVMPPIVNQSASPADSCPAQASAAARPDERVGWRCGVAHAQGPLRVRRATANDGDLSLGEGNYVDHTITDQTSIIRFVEDNWLNSQRIGSGSFDGIANSIAGMIDFTKAEAAGAYILNPTTGEVMAGCGGAGPPPVRVYVNPCFPVTRSTFLLGAAASAIAAARIESPALDPERLAKFVDPLPLLPVAKSSAVSPVPRTGS